MVKRSNKKQIAPFLTTLRVARTSFYTVVLYMLVTIIFDSGNLLSRGAVGQRWIAASILLAGNVVAWYIIRSTKKHIPLLIISLALGQIIFVGFQTYWERGMASTSTILLALPILTIASLRNRAALLATATLTSGSYALAAVKYFNDFFNEGYRIQLWGNLVFYTGMVFILTWFIMNITGLRHDSE